jgi:hypothetical protein
MRSRITPPLPTELTRSLHKLARLMLQPRLLSLLIRNLIKRLPLLRADPAHTQPPLLQHHHVLQRAAGLAQLAQFLEANGHGELLPELDVDQAPADVVL